MRDETRIERAIRTAFRPRRRMSRRTFLRQTGRGAVVTASALTLPQILAACGIGPGGSSGSSAASQAPLPSAPAGTLDFANWPAYIDIDEETGDYPTLAAFEEAEGIDVAYTEAINDNEEFFGLIQPDLAAGNPPQYDLIVMTDWMIDRMVRLGYLAQLDQSRIPNFAANALDLYKDPWYDPGNAHSMAWQSGITGIGYNPTLTGREITSFDDLLDPEFAGQVGLFSDMRDMTHLTLLSMDVDPLEATIEQVQAAMDKLRGPAEDGQFRNFYGNEYYDELANGNLALTVAWSGDVSQMKLYDNSDVEFVIPESGGMLWVDNMAIPTGAAHPLDAHLMMNYWYDLASAVPLTEYVGYFSPVSGVAERVLEDKEAAEAEGDTEWAAALEVIAATSTPSEEALANVHNYRRLTEEEEGQWNELFNEVVAG